MRKNWLKLIILNNLKDIVRIFGNIFLSTYFFNVTDGDLVTIIKYWLVYCFSNLFYRYAICKFTNSHNVIKLYRLSLFANLVTVSILLLLRENIVNYIYLFSLLQSFAISLYYASYENIMCSINTSKNFRKYFSLDSLIANSITIVAPLCLGILIETYSYLVAFIVLFILTIACFTFSLFLSKQQIKCEKIDIPRYLKSIKNMRIYNKTMLQNFFDGFNEGGPSSVLMTVIIYSQISSETLIGGVNSISNIVAILFSFLCIKVISKKNFGKIVIPITLLIFSLTIPISIHFSLILTITFLILNQIDITITDINGNAITYEILTKITKKKYQNDYLWNVQFIFDLGRIVGYILVLLVAIYSYENLKYLLIVFSLGFVIRSLIINNLMKEQNT